ncbi:biopolymer transporter ExbD [Iodidimonas sp. SYSU 1G8]|uniref:ExbD/TolR family protein n=1 Tax=Iodidimonas sp. SYSU 1G8 TaxID=3133967 RepID=UPI0031FEBC2B
MGMSVTTGSGDSDDVMMDINTTPLIDVMLVLLIMFIITIPIQTHAVKLDMPQSNNNPPPAVEPVVVELQVDFDGTVLWNGNVVSSMGQLNGYLSDIASQVPQPEIHIRPHKLVKYDYVAKVMASAQRLGLTKMGLINDSVGM